MTWLRRLLGARPVPRARVVDKVKLQEHFSQLGPNGREVLLYIAARLVAGHAQYGDFDKGRDYGRECAEEYADGAIYAARWALEQREQRG